jgi:hypothetical protein
VPSGTGTVCFLACRRDVDRGTAACVVCNWDQTGQESRSAGCRAAHSVIVMDITIHTSFLPHDDPEASLAF